MMMMGAFMMFAMAIGFVVVGVLIGVVIALVIRWIGRQPSRIALPDRNPATGQPSALELLRERFARGEIDTTTFGDMVTRLDAPRDRNDPFQSAHQ